MTKLQSFRIYQHFCEHLCIPNFVSLNCFLFVDSQFLEFYLDVSDNVNDDDTVIRPFVLRLKCLEYHIEPLFYLFDAYPGYLPDYLVFPIQKLPDLPDMRGHSITYLRMFF